MYSVKVTGWAVGGDPVPLAEGGVRFSLQLSELPPDAFWMKAFGARAQMVREAHPNVAYDITARPGEVMVTCPKSLFGNVASGVKDMVRQTNIDAQHARDRDESARDAALERDRKERLELANLAAKIKFDQ